jgi:inorganic triphosphatase YgiF
MNPTHEETELKLTVLDPGVLKDIALWMELASFHLASAPTRQIRDQYWDAPGGQLVGQGITLRQRSVKRQRYLTLKGPATVEAGLFRRFELEVPADADGWRQVLSALADRGIVLAKHTASSEDSTEWLRRSGLIVTQQRSTHRQVRLAQREGITFAELALDQTTFTVDGLEVTMREIEIEATTADVDPVLALGRELRARLGDRVRESRIGKYGMGLLIAARLEGLSEAVDPE